MSIKHIEARFTSGNSIPITKAMVPIEEWQAVLVEIKMLRYDSAAYYLLLEELTRQVSGHDDLSRVLFAGRTR